jgi:hypothetical protein
VAYFLQNKNSENLTTPLQHKLSLTREINILRRWKLIENLTTPLQHKILLTREINILRRWKLK